jgi:hypothetical protein
VPMTLRRETSSALAWHTAPAVLDELTSFFYSWPKPHVPASLLF